jgi:hypothetical protein
MDEWLLHQEESVAKTAKQLRQFEDAVENAFNAVRKLTQKYDLPEKLIRKLDDLQDHFLEHGKASIREKLGPLSGTRR